MRIYEWHSAFIRKFAYLHEAVLAEAGNHSLFEHTMKLFRNLTEAVNEALEEIFNENRYADKVIERVLKQNPKWGSRDRKFIAETTYEMVRWWRLLSEITPHTNQESIKKYSGENFWNLFGAYLVLNNQELPVWEEFKNINRELIINNLEKIKSIRKIRESIPDWLDETCAGELAEDVWEKEIRALNEQAKVVLRTNTLKTTRSDLQGKLLLQNIETGVVDFSLDALALKQRQNIFQLPEFKEGLFEVQDAASQLVAPFLKAETGMRVIDACAGGGGKTLHLAALMKNKGKIIAMDTEQWKLDELKRRARRAGASNIETKIIESNKTIKRLQNSADRLLLDVPCSGLGVLKRNPDAKWKLSHEYIERVKKQQQEILQNYSSMLKKDGILVYATCSILPSENEKQVEKFLSAQKGNFELLEEKKVFPSMGFDGFYMVALKKKI